MNGVQRSNYITTVSVTGLVPDCIIAMSPVISTEAVRIARPDMRQHHGAFFIKTKQNCSVKIQLNGDRLDEDLGVYMTNHL